MSAFPASAQDSVDDRSVTDEQSQSELGGTAGFVDVIRINGLIDPVMADFITSSLVDAETNGARAVVLQMETSGATVSDDEIAAIATQMVELDIPVSIWIGQANNGLALGRAGQLVLASSQIGIAPGSEFGDFGESVLEGEAATTPFVELFAAGFEGEIFDYDELVTLANDDSNLGIRDAPLILRHLLELPEFESTVMTAGDVLPDGSVLAEGSEATTIASTSTRFVALPLIDAQFHTFASPPVAYLLFVIGLGLLVFELFTAGVGVAGLVGAGSLLAGSYGLAVLDARWWAVALIVIAFVGFAIDVQSGIQAFWSGVGVLFLILGSLFLLVDHSIGWLPLTTGIVGMLFAMLGGMPAMVRTRFSTPTIGRDWMIGELAEVVESIDPDGIVSIRGASWRARTNRATPILMGDRARVVEIDGLLLEVEPESGGAIDYRERRGASSEDEAEY